MRKALILFAPVSLFALASCGNEAENEAPFGEPAAEIAADAAVSEEAAAVPSADGELAALGSRPEIPLTLPKMAYTFDLGFRLAAEDVVPLQQEHADMCESL